MDGRRSSKQKSEEEANGVPILSSMMRRFSVSSKQIRKETFTRWCNHVLKSHGISVDDITTDIPDGTTLVKLYEALSKSTLKDVLEAPSTQKEKQYNIDVVLRAMDYHSIPCDKIDIDVLTKGDLVMILDMLWNLFLRFELDIPLGGQNLSTEFPKLVLVFLQSVLGNKTVENLSSDWSDGIALSKLINILDSDLIQDTEYLLKQNGQLNLERAMKTAWKHFEVPILLNAKDVANNHTDELCMSAYFSYFMKESSIGEKWTIKMLDSLNSDIEITTLAKNLNLGILFHKLVNKLIPVERATGAENGTNLARIQFSMDVAKKCLGVNNMIQPEDFQNPKFPRIELISYLSQFNLSKRKKKSISSFYRSGSVSESSKLIRVNGELDRDFCSSQESLNSSTLELSGPFTDPEPGTYVIKLFDNIKLDTSFPSMDNINKEMLNVSVDGDGLKEAIVNENSSFVIKRNSSCGKLEVSVEDPLGVISSATLTAEKDDVVRVEYIPHQGGLYRIYIFIDGLQIDGCPFEVNAIYPKGITVNLPQPASDGIRYGCIKEDYIVAIHSTDDDVDDLKAYLCREKGEQEELEFKRKDHGSFVININVDDIGEYELYIYCRNSLLSNFPLLLVFNNPALCVVHGAGLLKGLVGELCEFEVDARDAGSGILNMSINNDKDIVADVLEINNNHYSVSYVPSHAGTLNITLLYSGMPIRGSPFLSKIVDPASFVLSPVDVSSIAVGERAAIEMEVKDEAAKDDFRFDISGPSGNVDGKLEFVNNDKVILTFLPEIEGIYKIEMFMDDYLIKGTPFFVQVKEQPSYPEKVFLKKVVDTAIVDSPNRITVDTTSGGHGKLTVEAHGHEKEVVLGYNMSSKGIYTITYYPQETGPFQLSIKWSDKHIKGSPFTITAQEEMKAPVNDVSKIILGGSGLKEAIKDKVSVIQIDAKNAGQGPLHVFEVDNKTNVFLGVRDDKDGHFTITYVPNVEGDILLGMTWDGQTIPGSPFKIQVKEEKETVAEQTVIKLSGNGLDKATVGKENLIQANVSGGSRPDIAAFIIGVQGPLPVQVRKIDDGVIKMTFIPTEEGPLSVTVKQDGKDLVGFPREIQASNPPSPTKNQTSDSPKKVVIKLSGNGLDQASVGEENVIRADISGDEKPMISASIIGSDGSIPVKREQNNDDVVEFKYTPIKEGPLFITIRQSDKPLEGFPREIQAKQNFVVVDARKVEILDGIDENGILNFPISLHLDTSKTGSSDLTCICTAPSGVKTAGTFKKEDNGRYVIDLNLAEEGRHKVNIYWGGSPLNGSPFTVIVKQKVDPGKVRVYGEGLSDGFLGEYEGKFYVQTKGAGPGTLTVTINGPQGAFRVNMDAVSRTERIVCVTYGPKETGTYFINVYWADQLVPGSPFMVRIKEKEGTKEPHQLRRVVTYHEPSDREGKKEKRRKTFSLIGRKKKKAGKAKFVEVDSDGKEVSETSRETSRRSSAASSSSGSQPTEEPELVSNTHTNGPSTKKQNGVKPDDLDTIPES